MSKIKNSRDLNDLTYASGEKFSMVEGGSLNFSLFAGETSPHTARDLLIAQRALLSDVVFFTLRRPSAAIPIGFVYEVGDRIMDAVELLSNPRANLDSNLQSCFAHACLSAGIDIDFGTLSELTLANMWELRNKVNVRLSEGVDKNAVLRSRLILLRELLSSASDDRLGPHARILAERLESVLNRIRNAVHGSGPAEPVAQD